jgi:glycosyltransferase involved in cell wall biosynthesis
MKVVVYNPSLEILGGGEKYSCTIAEILSAEHDVHLLSHAEHISKNQIEERLNVDLSSVKIVYLPKFQNIQYVSGYFNVPRIFKYYKERKNYGMEFQRNFDLFVNIAVGEPIFCHAKTGILHVQFPFDLPPRKLRRFPKLPQWLYYTIEWKNRIKSYRCIIVNSNFTKMWLKKRWNVNSNILYPPIDTEKFRSGKERKKIILNVGRFFVGGHNKKQHILIGAFRDLCDDGLKGWELHLIGGITNNNKDQNYLDRLYQESMGYPILIHKNFPFAELQKYYQESSIYWHATGYGEREEDHPEKMEHFGMTTVEAMSAGCVPVVINRGGQPEIVRHNIDGYLWGNLDELKNYTKLLVDNEEALISMSRACKKRSQYFGKEEFRKRLLEIVRKVNK